jgi:hypothetical protein
LGEFWRSADLLDNVTRSPTIWTAAMRRTKSKPDATNAAAAFAGGYLSADERRAAGKALRDAAPVQRMAAGSRPTGGPDWILSDFHKG